MTREIKYVALKNGQVDIYSSDEETESFDDEYDSERDPLADDYSDAESNGSFPSSDDSADSTNSSQHVEMGTNSNSLNSLTDSDDDDETVISALSTLGSVDFPYHRLLVAEPEDDFDDEEDDEKEGYRVHNRMQTSSFYRTPTLPVWNGISGSGSFLLSALQDANSTEQEEESVSISLSEHMYGNRSVADTNRTRSERSVPHQTSPRIETSPRVSPRINTRTSTSLSAPVVSSEIMQTILIQQEFTAQLTTVIPTSPHTKTISPTIQGTALFN